MKFIVRNAMMTDYESVIKILDQVQLMHVEWRPDIYKQTEDIIPIEIFKKIVNENTLYVAETYGLMKRRIEMISPDKVNEASVLKEDENLEFRTFLKIHANEKELDEHFIRLHEELFQSYDCRQCRNCCKEYVGSIPWSDVRKDARYLKLFQYVL